MMQARLGLEKYLPQNISVDNLWNLNPYIIIIYLFIYLF